MGVAREPSLALLELGSVQVGVGHHLDHPAHQVVAQGGDPRGVVGLLLHGHLDGGGETRDRRGVDRPGPDVALLAAAVHQRHQVELTAHDERADAERAPPPCAR